MPINKLIQSVPVVFEQIDKENTQWSGGVSGRREHYNNVVRKTKVTVQAQIVHGNTQQVSEWQQMGVGEHVKGYLVMRLKDIDSLNLQRGDKIVKLAQLDVEYYLIHSKGDPAAHFPSLGGFTLVRHFFADREPTG